MSTVETQPTPAAAAGAPLTLALSKGRIFEETMPLLAAESGARAKRLGIWAEPYYSLKQANRPQSLAESEGRYELVEGRVLLAEAAGRNIYLNFGRNWNVDFTAVIDQKAQSLFAESGIDPLVLNGALVRLRGWIEDRDGPRMAVTHPEQIEVLATQ